MTPSITETISKASGDGLTPKPTLDLTGQNHQVYKDLTPNYQKKIEEEGGDGHSAAKYSHYLPTWSGEEIQPPLQEYQHHDRGNDADPEFPNLLRLETKVSHLTPNMGTEIEGIQLSSLNDAGKNELARYVAERKVVAFRGQDFADLPIAEVVEFVRYFGRLHVHTTAATPAGYPEVLVVHRGAGDKAHETVFKTRTSSVAWHSDVTYEEQPPGTTFLHMLESPDTGGDTLFADAVVAYKRLSPSFQKLLHGLSATHSGVEQVNASVQRGSVKRREAVVTAHPIVRTHPVTGEKALFVNPQFTREIVGLKKEESDAILNFLYQHIAAGADFHARVKWSKDTVVVWDNRVVLHTALVDWQSGQRRHLARITPQAERPYETPFGSDIKP